jgi:hypothetical protein
MRGVWLLSLGIASSLTLLPACGGRVVQQGNGAGGASPDGGSSTSYNDGSHNLGPCVEGTSPYTAGPCPWLGSDGLCYPTVDAACNCVCPRDHASTCVSGFPGGPQSKVLVSCS